MSNISSIISKLTRLVSRVDYLAWIFPLLLCVPNIGLAITEQDPIMAKLTNVVLPLGVYLLLMSLSRKVGRSVVYFLPIIIFCAWEIVLLYLYGQSIIAIDMFLNLVTTNVKEATELLGNLTIAIVVVCICYVPPLAWAIWSWCKHFVMSEGAQKLIRRTGLYISAVGLLMLIICWIFVKPFAPYRHLFPLNVSYNLCAAVERTARTFHYIETSAQFSHDAIPSHPKEMKEVYVLVLGETSRADNWQIMGYDRETNPELSKRSDIVAFDKVISEANTTHKSVPMILSYLDSNNYGDSIYFTKSIFEAFNQSGFSTAFISNQRRNHSFIDFFGEQAQVTEFIVDNNMPQYDMELLGALKTFLDKSTASKHFVVLHCYGSHFNYKERYPKEFAHFTPANATQAATANRDQLVNAYDNTIRYTDVFLDSLIGELEEMEDVASAMIYLSDHGEDIFDDDRERFLHSSPTPTYYQIHVPMILWMSPTYRQAFPAKFENARKVAHANISSSSSTFHTLLDIAGLSTPYYEPRLSLTDNKFQPAPRIYITDYNEGVPLAESGLRKQDFKKFNNEKISYK